MSKKLNTVFVIIGIGLAVASLIFFSIAIFCETASEWILPAGFLCCALSNLLNLTRSFLSKTK